MKKKKLKQTNASVHLIQYRFKIREGSPEGIRRLLRKGFVKEMSFKSEVKDRGDRWWERRWWLWWGDMRKMRWTRRTVNTMRLTEWRRELIPQVRWRTGRVWSVVHQNRSWYRNRSTSGSDETTSASSIRRRLDTGCWNWNSEPRRT